MELSHPWTAPELGTFTPDPAKGLGARIQNAAVILGLNIWYFMPKVGWEEEEGRKGHRSGAAGLQTHERPLNPISAGVGSQHCSCLELCLEWIFLNESFTWKLWKTQNSSGVQWIGSFIQSLSKTPSTGTVSGTFSSDYLFPPTLNTVSRSKELLDHSVLSRDISPVFTDLNMLLCCTGSLGLVRAALYCADFHYSLWKWL